MHRKDDGRALDIPPFWREGLSHPYYGNPQRVPNFKPQTPSEFLCPGTASEEELSEALAALRERMLPRSRQGLRLGQAAGMF